MRGGWERKFTTKIKWYREIHEFHIQKKTHNQNVQKVRPRSFVIHINKADKKKDMNMTHESPTFDLWFKFAQIIHIGQVIAIHKWIGN